MQAKKSSANQTTVPPHFTIDKQYIATDGTILTAPAMTRKMNFRLALAVFVGIIRLSGCAKLAHRLH